MSGTTLGTTSFCGTMSHGRLTLLIAIYTNDGGTDGAIGIEADGLARNFADRPTKLFMFELGIQQRPKTIHNS